MQRLVIWTSCMHHFLLTSIMYRSAAPGFPSARETTMMDLSEFDFDLSTPTCEVDVFAVPAVEEVVQQQQPPQQRQQAQQPALQSPELLAGLRRTRGRARQACKECHKRKVRCDILTRGPICTNCRLDGHACVLRKRNSRRKASAIAKRESAPPPRTPLIPKDEEQIAARSRTLGTPFEPPPEDALFASASAADTTASSIDLIFSHYAFLEAESVAHLAPEDFRFLLYKGCFHIPPRPVLDAFIREYFLHVHPMLPLVDEGDFWDMYADETAAAAGQQASRTRVPLFLFRAMLFVSAAVGQLWDDLVRLQSLMGGQFVSTETLQLLGFSSGIAARNTMYRRAKLLYDFRVPSEPIAMAQGALLMAYYCSEREQLANTTWLSLAIQYCTSENVHLYYLDASLTFDSRRMRKRLWWCCILRDRILPLGVRRPIQITRDKFDFSQPPLSAEDLECEFDRSKVYDRKTKHTLAGILNALLYLAVELTDVISLVYPINSFSALDQLDYESLMDMPPRARRCREGLASWATQWKQGQLKLESWPAAHKSVSLFSGTTRMYFHSALLALCQYETFALQAVLDPPPAQRMLEIGRELSSSVTSISDTVREFIRLDVARYLPVSAVAYMALPIILSSLIASRVPSKQQHLLAQAMALCRARYSGASGAAQIISRTVALARAPPALQLCAAPDRSGSEPAVAVAAAAESWLDVFLREPKQFLRLALTVDISFSIGRFPALAELPKKLMLEDAPPRWGIPQALPVVERWDQGRVLEVVEEEGQQPQPVRVGDWMVPPEKDKEGEGRRTDLDFFDLSKGKGKGKRCALPESPWHGVALEGMLEEVLMALNGVS